jgi:hypothetical protein
MLPRGHRLRRCPAAGEAHHVFRTIAVPLSSDVVDENSPSNLARNDQPFIRSYFAPAVTSALSAFGTAPLTTKFDPGSAWKIAVVFGVLPKSCAQARRP